MIFDTNGIFIWARAYILGRCYQHHGVSLYIANCICAAYIEFSVNCIDTVKQKICNAQKDKVAMRMSEYDS